MDPCVGKTAPCACESCILVGLQELCSLSKIEFKEGSGFVFNNPAYMAFNPKMPQWTFGGRWNTIWEYHIGLVGDL